MVIAGYHQGSLSQGGLQIDVHVFAQEEPQQTDVVIHHRAMHDVQALAVQANLHFSTCPKATSRSPDNVRKAGSRCPCELPSKCPPSALAPIDLIPSDLNLLNATQE